MAGTLIVVATPIGNLEDITLRALRVLREVRVIAAEDTRRTAHLLAHYGIGTPTLSFHQHNTRTRIPQIIARLQRGEDVALVTDAGTPGVSDPGTELIRASVEHGLAVDVLPGANASLTAAVASGFDLEGLSILGFPPTRSKDRMDWFLRVAAYPHTIAFFEAPHRINRTLTEGSTYWGNRPILVARELTKVHQEFIRGFTTSDVIGLMTNSRGEFTVVVGPSHSPIDSGLRGAAPCEADIAAEFDELPRVAGRGRRQQMAQLAKKHGLPVSEIYAIIERTKNSGI